MIDRRLKYFLFCLNYCNGFSEVLCELGKELLLLLLKVFKVI